MRVALIDPPTSFDQIYGQWDLSKMDTYCPPLGLLHLASFIREHSHVPHVLDVPTAKWSCQETVERAISLHPDVIGLTAKTINIFNAADIAEGLRASGFDGPIIIGGAHVTAEPRVTLDRFPAIDYAIIGEGEITLLKLLERVDRKQSIDDMKGIAWRDSSGQIQVNPPRPLISDLDLLPLPAWDLLPNFPEAYPHNALETKRHPAASVITSRGCPFQCTFCDRAIFGSTVRHHSAEYTLNMIRYLKDEFGIRDLMFLDDNFMLDKTKLFNICEQMIREDMNISWYCQGHAKLMTDDRLEMMKQAGCWFVELGIESGCDRILKLIKKGTTKAQIEHAVDRAREAGLKVKGNFIFGFPTETKETLQETIQFATGIKLSYFQQNFLTNWPGCELAENPEQYGHAESDWRRLAHQRISFIPHGLTEQDLVQASKDAFRRFYLRPRIVLEVLLQSMTSTQAARNAVVAFVIFLKTILRRHRTMPSHQSVRSLP